MQAATLPALEPLNRNQKNKSKHYSDEAVARQILELFFRFRRISPEETRCQENCTSCYAAHIKKITYFINSGHPVKFVLPAFPAKSPNLNKVLGPLPDMAEIQALKFLETLCKEVHEFYPPGAKIILCSDGRVFSDVVGIKDSDVSAYQREIDRLIADFGLKHISTFNLDALHFADDFDSMRRKLVNTYAVPLEELKIKVKQGSTAKASIDAIEANRMLCGMTRFLVEDTSYPEQTKSRTSIQNDCKKRAYEVIRRSNAWSKLIEEVFPQAVRLSIHPQSCGAKKLGIRLVGEDTWITPWHGVAVKTNAGFILMKKSEAEAKGAYLISTTNGKPSHYSF